MTIPIKNVIYEIIRNAGALTYSELSKSLTKSGVSIPEDELNKTLLNLEIFGLIKVTWLTKDERRIEIAEKEDNTDEIERENMENLEREYEAGFPGVGQDGDTNE
jgi:arginine repressor